jgi:hypothetical protein
MSWLLAGPAAPCRAAFDRDRMMHPVHTVIAEPSGGGSLIKHGV